MHMTACLQVRGQPEEVSSLPLLCGFQGSNSEGLVATPLPIEPAHQPWPGTLDPLVSASEVLEIQVCIFFCANLCRPELKALETQFSYRAE